MKDKMKKKINNKKYLSGPEILKVMNISWSEKNV